MASKAQSISVLIVEDEPGDAALMVEHLREAGLEPASRRVETESEYLAALADPPDVILCDHRLPQFDSDKALRLLRELGLDIPFIIVSGALGEEEAVAAMRAGAADYLLKDRLARLASAVLRAMEERQVRAELRRAQRLEGIGTLAAGIAHDFNNILGIILGHAALAETPNVDRERLARSLETIRLAAERAAGLVRQILTIARRTKLRFQPVELNAIVEELAGLIRETFPRKVELRLELDPELPPVRADPTLVHQVLLNLCVNARDAMPDGGLLTIRTSCAEGRRGVAGRCAVVSVADRGVGMDAATLARIFDPFFTTKEAGAGTGLGLSVAHSVMESHGGCIDVESCPGRGSTFTLTFPVSEPSAAGPRPESERKGPAEPRTVHGRGETILVVEDEETLLAAITMTLEDDGYTVLGATTGVEALELFQQHSPLVDLVMTDLEMPGLSGRELVMRLRSLDPGIRVILTTGHLEPLRAAELAALGVTKILQKPFLLADLQARVRATLDAPLGRPPDPRSRG